MQVVVPGSRRHSYLDMSGAHSPTLPHHFFHLFDDLYLLKFCVGRISYILISWKRLMALLKDGFPNLVIFTPESYPFVEFNNFVRDTSIGFLFLLISLNHANTCQISETVTFQPRTVTFSNDYNAVARDDLQSM